MSDNDSSESIDTSRRSDSLKTNDTKDESGGDDDDDGQVKTVLGTEEQGALVNEHTCERNDNYNVEFKLLSTSVIGDLFVSKYCDPGRIICPKNIVSKMMEQHEIHVSYNKAYRSKEHTLNQVFGGLWESFHRLPSYFYVLEQANPKTVIKIKTDS
ncbi:hypothetical protein Ddye_000639 [Dipteronia dyeriana]|uniref:Uncharacterized protein n=1 Tax=Dipteronia dyeriana TaxID=168575 RepID=A0AAE0CSJ9_9ROSI|nr:hypothetical protein Ddye_000639 [Dipteronia dyeriana]